MCDVLWCGVWSGKVGFAGVCGGVCEVLWCVVWWCGGVGFPGMCECGGVYWWCVCEVVWCVI